MMSSDPELMDLLESAEQLTAGLGSRASTNDAHDLPRVQRNLAQLVEAGQELFRKSSRNVSHAGHQEAVKAAILLGSKGVDLPGLNQQLQTLESLSSTAPLAASKPEVSITDVYTFLRNEREQALLSVLDEVRRDTMEGAERDQWEHTLKQWEGKKQRILASVLHQSTGSGNNVVLVNEKSNLDSQDDEMYISSKSLMSRVELEYAKAVHKFNEQAHFNHTGSEGGKLLLKEMSGIFKQEADAQAFHMWEMVKAITEGFQGAPSNTSKLRSTVANDRCVSRSARSYLQSSFKRLVKNDVYGNLRQAELGGIPGTVNLIKSYIKLKHQLNSNAFEDGLADGTTPIWPLIYYCLRCGDIEAAIEASKKTTATSELSVMLQQALASSASDLRLNAQDESSMRLQYRRSVKGSSLDPFKKAVYCILTAADPNEEHSDIATTIDDYLWIKLCQIREIDEQSDQIGNKNLLSLSHLQRVLAEEYGETHFNASQEPLVYFQVLFLTGQFELALAFLFRCGHDRLKAHATHVALVMNEHQLLLLSTSADKTPLLSRSETLSSTWRLNLARLVVIYVRKFESTDPREALSYFFLLRNVKTGLRDDNVFVSCVSELVLESKEYDLILGTLDIDDNTRRPGLVDTIMKNSGETQKLIESVASEAEERGLLEEAAKLNDLAAKHERVVIILNRLLAEIVSQPRVTASKRERLQRYAISVAKRYRSLGHNASLDVIKTFYLLLDLMTFFDLVNDNKYGEAIDALSHIKLVPFNQKDVDMMVCNFRSIGDDVRRSVPDVLLAAMRSLHVQYKHIKSSAASAKLKGLDTDGGRAAAMNEIREKARALITFAGMIPYRMPGDTNAQLVKMEVLMN